MKNNWLNRLEYLIKIFDSVRFHKPETEKSQPNQTGLVKNKPNWTELNQNQSHRKLKKKSQKNKVFNIK